MTDQLQAIEAVLSDIDESLRKRLRVIGVDLAHIVVAIAPDGSAIVRGNVDPMGLRAVAEDLANLAEETMQQPSDGEAIH